MTVRPLAVLLAAACLSASAAAPGAATEGERTPLGALRAGTADGRIPAWSPQPGAEAAAADAGAAAACSDPYADEAPLFRIDRATADRHAANLSAGQRALLATLPESYALPVYASHRTASAPASFLAGTQTNASQARLGDDRRPAGAVAGLPFPVIRDGADAGLRAYWNFRLRWRGLGRDRSYLQATVSPSGTPTLTRLRQRAIYRSLDAAPTSLGPLLSASLTGVLAPTRLAGAMKLVHSSATKPPAAWQLSPGPDHPLLRATTEAVDDVPVFGADGLYNEDQREGFDAGPDRYDWTLAGSRELYVPYNAWRMFAAASARADLLGPRHVNPDRLRYELHRVHVLEAKLKPGLPGQWPRRTFYLDEDSWQILLVDLYGRSGDLERVQEVHVLSACAQPLLLPVVETVYDLAGQRYLLTGFDDERRLPVLGDIDPAEFSPDRARRWWRRNSAVPSE